MTRQEVIDFLHDKMECRKTDMRSIKGMIEQANKMNYNVIKNGIDDYDLVELGVITDFTKPLKVNRKLPDLAPNKTYGGVPVALFFNDICNPMSYQGFNYELWCLLMNKNDGDFIRFDEIINLKTDRCETYDRIVRALDFLSWLGFLKEYDTCLEIKAYPSDTHPQMPWQYIMDEIKRQAPYKYLS